MKRRLLTIVITAALLVIFSAAGPTRAAPLDLQNDPANCGVIGRHVPAGDVCRFGVATPAPR